MKLFRSDLGLRSTKIPADEPVFVLMASDPVAAEVVRVWCEFSQRAGVDPEITGRAFAWAQVMAAFGSAPVDDYTGQLVQIDDDLLGSMGLRFVEGEPAEAGGPAPRYIERIVPAEEIEVAEPRVTSLDDVDGLENPELILTRLEAAGYRLTKTATGKTG